MANPEPSDPPRIGRAAGIALQVAAGIVVALLAAATIEAGARIALAQMRVAGSRAGADFVGATIEGSDLAPELNPAPLVSDRFTLWRNRPGAQRTQPINPRPYGRSESWSLAIDSQGYRGPERRYAVPHPDRFRILCVGDSVTYGFNVDQGSEWPRRLEALLHTRYPDLDVEVINAGVPGWSWAQGLRFVQHEGLALAPDLVIAAHGTNDRFWGATSTDFERLPRAREAAPELRVPRWLARSGAWRLAALVWQRSIDSPARAPRASAACERETRETGHCLRMPLADIERAIGDLADELRGTEIPLFLLNLDFIETDAVQALRRAAERESLPFADFAARFRAERIAREAERERELGLAAAGPIADPAHAAARRVLFRALAPQGAAEPISVRGAPYLRESPSFRAQLHDDGAAGDERASDGVHSGYADAPAGSAVLEYQFWIGETPELEPLPPLPSAAGTRLLLVGGNTRAPIARVGDLVWMAERTHPNAEGHAVIAERLAELIPQLPAFPRANAMRALR